MKLFATILFLMISTLTVTGSDEMPDSVNVAPYPQEIDREFIDTTAIYTDFDKLYSEFTSRRLKADVNYGSDNFDIPEIKIDAKAGVAQISSWRNGAIYATGRTETMPGLMAINTGSLKATQNFENLTITVYGTASKYGYFRGLQTSYGFGGELTYRFSDKISATVFGAYHSPLRVNQPAMAGYISVPTFGGYIDYSFADRFGVEVGAQGYRSMLTKRIEAQPIVKPYFRLSKNNKIGVDVGGIFYNILRSNAGNKSWGNQNPTIGPPVMKLSEMMGY